MGTSLLPNLDGWFVGFEDMVNAMAAQTRKTIPSYPPCNVRKVASNKYVIEMALAGFSKNDIEITLHKDALTITGRVQNEEKDASESYLFKSIAQRSFQRDFLIEDSVVIQNASFINGLLRINLERMVTHDDTKKIEIQDEETTPSTKKFLTE